jgi:effector-binding domain-containing protein
MMFKIGEFSRLSQVSVKTLRYYDEIGLLTPAEIDRFTGYRYYTANQLPRLNRILVFKGLGFPLEQIARLLDEDLSVEEIRGMLRIRKMEIQQRITEEQAQLGLVEARLRQIEQEGTMPTYEVTLKEIPAQTVAGVRDVVPTPSEVSRLFGELFGHLGRQRVKYAGPPMSIYHDPEFSESDIDVEVAAPVEKTPPDSDRVKSRELPAIHAASVVHQGPYEAIGEAYAAVMHWIEENGYHITAPIREVYLRGPGQGEPETYVTELVIPVEKT